MRIECPHCGVRGTLDDVHAGKTIRCPKCHRRFVAGSPDGACPESPDQQRAWSVDGPGASEEIQAPAADEPREAGYSSSDGEGETGDRHAAPGDGTPMMPPPPPWKPVGGDDGAKEHGRQQTALPPHPPRREEPGLGPAVFDVGKALNQAWELTRGVKGPIWGGLLVTYGVTMLLAGILMGLVALLDIDPHGLAGTLFDLTNSAFSAIFTAGLMLMGVHRVRGEPVVWTDVFAGFSMAGQLVVAALLQMILVGIGLVLLILPGIYLMVGYMMTFPLMLRQGLAPWQAMEASRKAIHKVWWKMFGLSVVMMLICAISAIPFGIGLIWTLPLAVVLSGVIYCQLFAESR